ncbi:Bug family tripartite tricarboxylate transporter substrate binding protein [Roseomonas sp. BN140053]|uniref:Bug family tripartite tricarboxylate transporter substrate binding protein n=1 Tax=Roseomonas sp. BN140053 TaxID=3391898 RepID=UPI0039E96141
MTSTTRRGALAAALGALALGRRSLAQGAAPPLSWPAERPVRLIVPLAAGGTSDFLARSLGNRLSELTGVTFVVENRTGGGGAVGWQAVARSAPDGTTIGLMDNALPIALALGRELGFDPRTELEPVSLLVNYAPVVVVSPSLPVTDLAGFVNYARQRPGELFFGSGGGGSSTHLQTELFQEVAGLRLNHVSYRGMAQAVTDLVGGRLQLLVSGVPTVLGQLRSGALRALAVGTEGPRLAVLPAVPSARETGLDFVVQSSFGIAAPRGTPAPTLARMQAAMAAALASPELRQRLEESGGAAVGSTPEEYRRAILEEAERWTRIVRERGIQAE